MKRDDDAPAGALSPAEAEGVAALLRRGFVPVPAGDVAAAASLLHDLCRAPALVARLRERLRWALPREGETIAEGNDWHEVWTTEGELLGHVPVPLFDAGKRGEIDDEEIAAIARQFRDPAQLGSYRVHNERGGKLLLP